MSPDFWRGALTLAGLLTIAALVLWQPTADWLNNKYVTFEGRYETPTLDGDEDDGDTR